MHFYGGCVGFIACLVCNRQLNHIATTQSPFMVILSSHAAREFTRKMRTPTTVVRVKCYTFKALTGPKTVGSLFIFFAHFIEKFPLEN